MRKAKGWTIEEMASMLGISKSHLSEVETGKKNLSTPMMDAVAHLFGVGVIELYDAGDIAADLAAIADELRDMTEEQRRTAVRLVQSLRKP